MDIDNFNITNNVWKTIILIYLKMSNIPRLRGHHLICLHFFNGKGYNLEFVENLRNTMKTIAKSGIEVVQGADDVCKKCPYLKNEKCLHDEFPNEDIIEMDKFALALLKENFGVKIKWDDIKKRLPEIFILWVKKYCKKCSWGNACKEDSLYKTLRYGKDA